MRIVAKFQFTAPSSGTKISDQISEIIARWSSHKFDIRDDGSSFVKQDGKEVLLDSVTYELDGQRLAKSTVLEPVEGGRLQTDISVLADIQRTAFRCTLHMISDGGIAPSAVTLRAPRFIRDIIALNCSWTVGLEGEAVSAQSLPFDAEHVPHLDALITSSERRLPIVIVSELDGETLFGDLHDRLSQDLCGLAHTVRLSADGSWGLTRRRGKEWSCYNGAVRLLWPFRFNRDDFRAHPLWTLDQMVSRASDHRQARENIRKLVASHIIEASTFVSDDPAFHDFDVKRTRHAYDEARVTAQNDGDASALAQSYAAENDNLRARVDTQQREIEDLRANVEALMVAVRSSLPQRLDAGTGADAPPQTVIEAVAMARRELGDNIVIAVETDDELQRLQPFAGPPDKLLRYLRVLRQLSDTLAMGKLGKSVPIWLRDNGVECSVDSETAKTNKEAQRLRARLINGEYVDCEYHAKPSDGVRPDLCVRIYFAVTTAQPFVKIGYIGRHFE